jgi:hypothetical protein
MIAVNFDCHTQLAILPQSGSGLSEIYFQWQIFNAACEDKIYE